MSATTEKPAGATAIRPFTIPVTSQAELEALRAHRGHALARQELVADHSQGPQLAVMQELAATGRQNTTGASARRSCTPCRTS